MIDMSSQIISNCCYLCFSELLKIKGNPRVRFVCLYHRVCLSCALKRPKTLPGENAVFSGRFVLKRFISLCGQQEKEAFERSTKNVSHTDGSVCISRRSSVDYNNRERIITREVLTFYWWFTWCHVISVTTITIFLHYDEFSLILEW